jgi:hypothetical protein
VHFFVAATRYYESANSRAAQLLLALYALFYQPNTQHLLLLLLHQHQTNVAGLPCALAEETDEA